MHGREQGKLSAFVPCSSFGVHVKQIQQEIN